MSTFARLADHLVAEVPIGRLQRLFGDIPVAGTGGGNVCGLGCNPGTGALCGFSCRPPAAARDVIDPDGRLGLTAKDLDDIRRDLPKLRLAVVDQVESHLGHIR